MGSARRWADYACRSAQQLSERCAARGAEAAAPTGRAGGRHTGAPCCARALHARPPAAELI